MKPKPEHYCGQNPRAYVSCPRVPKNARRCVHTHLEYAPDQATIDALRLVAELAEKYLSWVASRSYSAKKNPPKRLAQVKAWLATLPGADQEEPAC